jgi:hypothetical protein
MRKNLNLESQVMTIIKIKPIKNQLTHVDRQPALNDSLPEELERLINLSGVDWSEKLINRSTYRFNPIPVIPFNSTIYKMIVN